MKPPDGHGSQTSPLKNKKGKAWCDNLERYSDYTYRLPRGRTYVRNGSVIDLKRIAEGRLVPGAGMPSSLPRLL